MLQSRYSVIWKTADERMLVLEEMTTEHLKNVYAHTLNNYAFYLGMFTHITGDQLKARAEVEMMRSEIKQELLSRGLTDEEIESHIEDTSHVTKVYKKLK